LASGDCLTCRGSCVRARGEPAGCQVSVAGRGEVLVFVVSALGAFEGTKQLPAGRGPGG